MLETTRLIIRPLTTDDAIDIQSIFDHPRFYYLDAEYAAKSAQKFLRKYTELHNEDESKGSVLLALAVVLKSSNTVIGCFSLGNDHLLSRLSEYGAEVTGFLHPHYWGKKFPQEILGTCLTAYAQKFGIKNFYGTADPTNKSSIAVMRRFGFQKADSISDPMQVKLYGGLRDIYVTHL
jgi:RimJ/RimL family protein N-acetyltransferase